MTPTPQIWVVAFGEAENKDHELGFIVKVVGWLPGGLLGVKSLTEVLTQACMDGAVLFHREIFFPEIQKWLAEDKALNHHPDAKELILTSIGQARALGIES
jgi:hypothetical protein